jgi:uncharacterized membrane protein
LVVLVLPVNVYLFTWRFVDLERRDYPYYLKGDEISAMRWLETHSASSDVVLSSLGIGQYVPTVSGNSAFLAHWAETLDFLTKRRLVGAFFNSASSDAERRQMLGTYHVRYVFFSAQEQLLGGFDPRTSSAMERVYESPAASVYQIVDAEGSGRAP